MYISPQFWAPIDSQDVAEASAESHESSHPFSPKVAT